MSDNHGKSKKPASNLANDVYYSEYRIGKNLDSSVKVKSKNSALPKQGARGIPKPDPLNYDIRQFVHRNQPGIVKDVSAKKVQEMIQEFDVNAVTKEAQKLNSLCCLEAFGFDKQNGDSWIYPTNTEVLQYQYDIVKTALFHNTFIGIPNGLGFPFISSVVLANFHRWYQDRLVLFIAPNFDIAEAYFQACRTSVDIDPSLMAVLTLVENEEARSTIWKEKRVIFTTTTVFLHEQQNNLFELKNVRCLIFAECDDTEESHYYATVVKLVYAKTKLFRVVALSNALEKNKDYLQTIFQNLLISRLEIRNFNSADILPYIKPSIKQIKLVKFQGYAKEVLLAFANIIKVYVDRLVSKGETELANSKLICHHHIKKCQQSFNASRAKTFTEHQRRQIEKDYSISVAFSTGLEFLRTHGASVFYGYIKSMFKQANPFPGFVEAVTKDDALRELIVSIEKNYNILKEESIFEPTDKQTRLLFPITTKPVKETNVYVRNTVSHPKLNALKEVIREHFDESKGFVTRAIILSRHLKSCEEIVNSLKTINPLVKPELVKSNIFDDDYDSKMKKREMKQTMINFKEGKINVIVSKGFGIQDQDLAELDLIVCYDVGAYPTKLFDRMRLSERKRTGKIIFLVSSEKEIATLKADTKDGCLTPLEPKSLQHLLYSSSPRMIPTGINPECILEDVTLSINQKQSKSLDIDLLNNAGGGESRYYTTEPNDVYETLSQPLPPKEQKKVNFNTNSTNEQFLTEIIKLQKTLTAHQHTTQSKEKVAKNVSKKNTLSSSIILTKEEVIPNEKSLAAKGQAKKSDQEIISLPAAEMGRKRNAELVVVSDPDEEIVRPLKRTKKRGGVLLSPTLSSENEEN